MDGHNISSIDCQQQYQLSELVWKCVEQSRLKSLEIIEAPDLSDFHFHNVENCKKGTKDEGASGNCVNLSMLSVKVAGWHIVFQYRCAGELEIFQVLLCMDFITCFL